MCPWLLRALATIRDDYDFVVVDTPPALQVRTLNGIAAANDVIIPCTAGPSALDHEEAVSAYLASIGRKGGKSIPR